MKTIPLFIGPLCVFGLAVLVLASPDHPPKDYVGIGLAALSVLMGHLVLARPTINVSIMPPSLGVLDFIRALNEGDNS